MASEVAAQASAEKFGAVSVSSFTAFEDALTQYMKENYVVFVRSSSNRSTNAVLRYEWVYYKCSRRPPRPAKSRGIRRSYTRSTGCPVRFCLRWQRNHLAVTSYILEHNHKLSKFLYDRLPVNRRLTGDELGPCTALLKYGTPSCEVRQFVADEFGKILTTQDIYNYRRKCRLALVNDMPSVLAKLRETGRVLVWQSEEGHYSHICFSRWQQIALFRRLPDVVNVDGTHTTNRFGYKLYTFLITDGIGTGRPVMYVFVESERFASMRRPFGLFKEMMGEQYPVRTFVMDKLAAQMRAARVVFGCDVMLCYFHIRKAIRKHTMPYSRFLLIVLHTHRFRQDLQLLRRTDQRFVSYPTARWLYITRKWAVHAQSGMVHFGNVTNNRLENANGRLKDRVHHADTLEHAKQTVSRHAEWLMWEYHCDRRQIIEGNGYVLNVALGAATTKAALTVLAQTSLWSTDPDPPRRLTPVLGNAHARSIRRCGCRAYICFLFLEINRFQAVRTGPHKLFLNLLPNPPTMAVGLQPTGKRPPPTACDALREQVNRLMDKLQVMEPRKATASFKQMIVHGQILLRQGSNSATGGPPSVVEDTAPQPRWRSRDTDLGFCVPCDRPTTTSDRWCATDRVSYHTNCYDGEPCPLCGDALQACLKAFGPSKNRKGVLATRSAKRASYDVALDRSAESPHSVSRKSVCVRVFGSKEELLNGPYILVSFQVVNGQVNALQEEVYACPRTQMYSSKRQKQHFMLSIVDLFPGGSERARSDRLVRHDSLASPNCNYNPKCISQDGHARGLSTDPSTASR
ncbi:hypothetical protein CLF_103123 [Clonorchis sinensis]|uniref:ZSWIM1/3 RNaseH-like domain-containing protein n=1 Tax=Clonorchis sinensis TaxID=79923 RepID=G7Y949_CLOSI|nr:hypothetical protein CLF_103123 [Clonorchis sinensis]